jgi:predicted DNA-binding transcriptional regulator AlpA
MVRLRETLSICKHLPQAESRRYRMRQEDAMEEYLTRVEAAEICRSSVATLARWAYTGTGPRYVMTRGKTLYRRSDVDAWLLSQKARTKAGTVA